MTVQTFHYSDMLGALAFLGLATWAGYVAQTPEPSQLVTVGAAVHLLSMVWMLVQAKRQQALPDAPLTCVFLLAIGLGLRLCSTTYFQGYLPIDSTGDGPYQVLEGLTLLCALRAVALFEAQGRARDWRPCLFAVAACAVAGASCYGDLDKNPTFDGVYATSVYAELAATLVMAAHCLSSPSSELPLGFLLTQLSGMACRGRFWYVALPEIAPAEPTRLQQYFPEVLLGCHVVMVLAYGLVLLRWALMPQNEVAANPAAEPLAASPKEVGTTADLSTLMLGDLKIQMPKGCNQLVPVSAVYTAEGTLRVAYKPTA